MAVTILHKRNDTPGAIPTIAGLAVGEFAVNTADGEVFFVALIDPAGGTDAANKFIFNTQRPPKADGGEITVSSETFRLQSHNGDNLTTHAGDYINMEHT
jgi:hypothetical protein